MAGLFELYRRWRHTRGFGVHSPFAYRLVTEGVRPSRGYIYHAELLPGMTSLKRIAFRLDTLLRSGGYPAIISEIDEWLRNPELPLFISHPSAAQCDRIVRLLEDQGCGVALLSRRYIFAMARKQMALVKYTLL